MSPLDLFAWVVLVILIAVMIAVIVMLGMMPGHIARKRGHPWATAVSVGSWASLVFGLVLWPLMLVWAYVDVPAKRETAA
jgi:hypothetical protein